MKNLIRGTIVALTLGIVGCNNNSIDNYRLSIPEIRQEVSRMVEVGYHPDRVEEFKKDNGFYHRVR